MTIFCKAVHSEIGIYYISAVWFIINNEIERHYLYDEVYKCSKNTSYIENRHGPIGDLVLGVKHTQEFSKNGPLYGNT